MALIICQECGKEYSNKASSCPNCGCPTNYNHPLETASEPEDVVQSADFSRSGDITEGGQRKRFLVHIGKKEIIILSSVVILIVGILVMIMYSKSDANIKRKLIGTWRLESVDGEEEGIAGAGLAFFEDGSFSFILNGVVTVSEWKLKNNRKLCISFGSGVTETYKWGSKDTDETDEWYVGGGVFRFGNSVFFKTDEDSSKAKKDIELISRLMEAAEKTALGYNDNRLCFVIKFDEDECEISVTNTSSPNTCISDWKANAGLGVENKLKSDLFHATGDNAAITGIIDSNHRVKWYAKQVTIPFAMRKWFY